MHITAYDSPQSHCDRLNSRVKEHTAALTGKGSSVRTAVCVLLLFHSEPFIAPPFYVLREAADLCYTSSNNFPTEQTGE